MPSLGLSAAISCSISAKLSGWNIFLISYFRANFFTPETFNWRPRPARVSGLVTTADTCQPSFKRARRLGTTKSSVPKNTSLADFFIVQFYKLTTMIKLKEAILIFNMIDKHNSLDVVYFVLENPCQKPFGLEPHRLPLFVCGPNSSFSVPGNFTVNVFNAQTTLKVFYNLPF